MLYTITANILVNVDDEQYPEHQDAVVTDGLNEMFRTVQRQDDLAAVAPFIVDWGYEAKPDEMERNIVARPDLTLASYEEGDAWAVGTTSTPTLLMCPRCASVRLDTLETVFCTAECSRITSKGAEFSGYTNYDAGDQETTGAYCNGCGWSYEGQDWLSRLIPTDAPASAFLMDINQYIWPSPKGGWVDAWNGWYDTLEAAIEEATPGIGTPWVLHFGEDIVSQDETDRRRAERQQEQAMAQDEPETEQQ
jgi:hypothetical protein